MFVTSTHPLFVAMCSVVFPLQLFFLVRSDSEVNFNNTLTTSTCPLSIARSKGVKELEF
jgi:hypothetical protein